MEFSYFLGIDISKDSFVSSLKNGSFIFKNRLHQMNLKEFISLENTIQPFKKNLLIGMESTGIYHKNLLNFLKNKGYNTIEIDPYIMWRFFRFKNPKPTVTDRKSSQNITEFLELHKNLSQNMGFPSNDKYSLRYFVREKERITQQIAKTKTEIRRILNLTFPEMEREFPLFNQETLILLEHFPSAERIRKIPQEEFRKILENLFKKKRGRKTLIKPERVYTLAKESISFNYPLYEEILKLKIDRLKYLSEEREKINQIIEQISDKFFKREIEILTSIAGIGKESAIHFMAEIIDIKRFPYKGKLIGFCGLDPVIKQSGNYKASLHISKRGNSHARRIVWIMAGCVKRINPYFRDY
ncbi:MAG: IS110 family transposase, partial [Candidatus Omnitrophica bacterium]|nr:IS110 family transposase [Candidatus Omnitrophota bacterium]